MSTDYKLNIIRKSDGKIIESFIGNAIKAIFDSEFSNMIHATIYHTDGIEFTVQDLVSVASAAFEKIQRINADINEKKILMALARKKEIKESFEEDILSLKESVEENRYIMISANRLTGAILCLVENRFSENKMAYEYNGLKGEDGSTDYLWEDGVYIKVEALY